MVAAKTARLVLWLVAAIAPRADETLESFIYLHDTFDRGGDDDMLATPEEVHTPTMINDRITGGSAATTASHYTFTNSLEGIAVRGSAYAA